jgi:DNA-binding transcriptional LysR family regulator
MTLEQLRVFVAVAERGHLTKASQALSLTPSAVSASIRGLEERYGAPLFDRVGRGIVLSDAGRSFLPQAKATLASAQATETMLADLGSGQRGMLHLQASQTIASYWLPPFLARFHERFPLVELCLTLGNTQTVAMAVVEGEAEIGFVEDRIDDPVLSSTVLCEDRFVVVMAPNHPWADGRPLAPAALLNGKWIMREQGSGTRSAFAEMLMALGVDSARLDIALTLPSNEAVCAAVMAGPYVTVVSTLVVAAELKAGLLCAANIALPPRQFHLVRQRTRYRSRVSIALEELVMQPASGATPPVR